MSVLLSYCHSTEALGHKPVLIINVCLSVCLAVYISC